MCSEKAKQPNKDGYQYVTPHMSADATYDVFISCHSYVLHLLLYTAIFLIAFIFLYVCTTPKIINHILLLIELFPTVSELFANCKNSKYFSKKNARNVMRK